MWLWKNLGRRLDDAVIQDESIVPDSQPEIEEEVEEEIEADDDADTVDVYSPSFRYGPPAVYAGTVSVLQGTVVEYQTVELSLNLQSIPAGSLFHGRARGGRHGETIRSDARRRPRQFAIRC